MAPLSEGTSNHSITETKPQTKEAGNIAASIQGDPVSKLEEVQNGKEEYGKETLDAILPPTNKELPINLADEPPFSIFSESEKKFYAYAASLAAFASPVSSTIYYPAVNVLAKDLDTSLANINLTITTYLIFQGLAPTIIGGISDRYGRRPAYLLCFVVFIAANTGLALQTSFPALLVLRCVQSSGSSGTIALSNGVVSDVATRAERGKYVGLAALGSSMGPALGPVIGGLLTHFLGWRAIFWFLDIYAGVILLAFAILIPETCRNIVGNGSVPSQRWNISLMTYLHRRKQRKANIPISSQTLQNKFRPGIMSSVPILLDKEFFLILIYASILYAGFYTILAGLPSQLSSTYHFNSIQIGLCYIPIGIGAVISRLVSGRLIDWNFARHSKILGLEISKSKQQSIEEFPIERARCEIALPFVYIACAALVPYGWVMNLADPPLPAVIILLFINTIFISGSFQAVSALVLDIFPTNAAAATAAANFMRCLLGAGGVAAVIPLLDKIGRGWTGMLIVCVWVAMSSCWWAVMIWGPGWRKEKRDKEKVKGEKEKEAATVKSDAEMGT